MELIYAWIGEFRSYKNVGINFSNKFIVNYNNDDKTINITRNKDYCSIYPDYITNINAIVGKNGVGKTNLLDMVGLRIENRNENEEEFKRTLKDKSISKMFHLVDDYIYEKGYNYFLIYYYGTDDNNDDLFVIECNDFEIYNSIFLSLNNLHIDKNYWISKGWSPFLCKIQNNKLEYINHIKEDQYKLCVLSFRENLNSKYYKYGSTKKNDESKIAVPRRIALFKANLLYKQIQFLHNQLQIDSRELFKNTEYILKIKYDDSYIHRSDNDFKLPYSYKKSEDKNNILKLLESFIYLYHYHLYIMNYTSPNDTKTRNNESQALKNINKKLYSIYPSSTKFEGFKEYYRNIIKVISENYFDEKDDSKYAIKSFNSLIEELLNNDLLLIDENSISFKITKDTLIDKISNFINIAIDERENENLPFPMYQHFFEYSIEDLSDGELAFLDIFTSLYEQIEEFTKVKSQYIILLDEPESRFHPELARTFINQLIRVLKDLSNTEKPSKIIKSFQVIISTHSPFILSDIPSDNIVYIEKDINGNSIPMNKNVKTLGSNIHTLLKDGFFMSSTIGEYTKSKIKAVIKFLESYKNNSYLEKDDTNKEIYTIRSIEECLYIIQSIGEPTIKRKLMKMYDDKIGLVDVANFQNNFGVESQIDVNATINRLQNQIEELKKCITILGGSANDKN